MGFGIVLEELFGGAIATREGWFGIYNIFLENGQIKKQYSEYKCLWDPNQQDILAMDWLIVVGK